MGESKIVCLDLETGNKLWLYDTKVDLAGRGFSKYSHSPDAIFLTLYFGHFMVAVSKTSGMELWRTPIPFSDNFPNRPETYINPGPATYSNGKVYCGFGAPSDSAREGGLIAFDAVSGKLVFFKTLPLADSTINFPQWKSLILNNTDETIFPYENSLVLSTRFYFEKTDLDGNIMWRTIPTYGPGAGQVGGDIAQVLHNGRIYGMCNGSNGAFGYSIDAQSGQLLWTAPVLEADKSPAYTSINGLMTDDSALYKISDISGLIGLDLQTGSTLWDSRLAPHIKSPIDNNANGGFAVEGKRVYFLSVDSIFCMQRTDK
jgi:outer membrane protein assembly factor BamB